jgi:aspartate-semialdehyde dehydrogenase
MKICVFGATGLVGREMIRVLEERGFGGNELIAAASARSAGKKIVFSGREIAVVTAEEALSLRPAVALFSAGAAASREWAPRFAEAGAFVIDNSSAWRREKQIPLVVPEINAGTIGPSDRIIANPNCSTIQLVMTLAPIHREYRILRVVVATYQSVTGSGAKGMNQLMAERGGSDDSRFYPHPIDLNLIPEAGEFAGDITSEEEKLAFETCKILDDDTIRVTATCVRVPVLGGHSEAVNIECERPVDPREVRSRLAATAGITVTDDPTAHRYPMPKDARGSDEVFVGRIRRDPTVPNGLNLWIVSDNLRKGAATNAVQIAQYLVDKGLVRN